MEALYGYAGKILKVDLSSGRTANIPTMDYADKFIGGMGIASKIYWDEASPDTEALHPESPLIFTTGPLAGVTGLAGSVWQVHGKSPNTTPEQFSYGSLVGSWGAQLKFAGYDGIIIQGKSERPVFLFIEEDSTQVRDASALWGKDAVETREILKGELGSSVRVVAIGPAGENMVTFATILADDDSSASCGFGAVMGSKNLKAIVVRGHRRPAVAKPEKLRELTRNLRKLKEGATEPGFAARPAEAVLKMKSQVCYSCINGCARAVFEATNGERGKFMCQSAFFYQIRSQIYYKEWNEVPFYANRLCDRYGLDTRVMTSLFFWLTRCYKAGILTDADTALSMSKLGSLEFIEALVKKISLRDGFGDILARGLIGAADAVGSGANELITDYVTHSTGQIFDGDPRVHNVTGLLYAMQPREHAVISEISGLVGKWHDWLKGSEGAYVSPQILQAISRRLFGDESAVDFSTNEGKGNATKNIQDRWSAKESLILCSFAWRFADVAYSDDHVGDPTLESQAFSAVTGREVDEEGLNKMGEVIFNLRRAVFAREGRRGRESEVLPEIFYTKPFKDTINPEDPCLVPGKDGEPIPKKGAVVDREEFERMKDDYYRLRGWDVTTGLQTESKLTELKLADVAGELGKMNLTR